MDAEMATLTEAALEEAFGPRPWKLNIGCGLDRIADYVHVDIEPQAEPDLVWDLEKQWGMPDSCVEAVEAKHVVEHIHDLKVFFQEAYRVMMGGSIMTVTVPHQCSDFFWGDPTHVRPITKMMLDLLGKDNCAYAKRMGFSNTPLATYWDVDFVVYEQQFVLHDAWLDKSKDMDKVLWAIGTYNNVASEVQFKVRCIKEGIQVDDQHQSSE